jgi:AraC-like DNA-binding protein
MSSLDADGPPALPPIAVVREQALARSRLLATDFPSGDKRRGGEMTTAMVRAQAMRGYRELVADLGGHPAPLLRKAGIDPSSLDQLTAFISFASMITLLERSAADLDCPDLGLRLAERQDIGILETLAIAIRNSTTLSEAVGCASKYLYVHNPAVAFTIVPGRTRDPVRLDFDVLVEHAPQWAQTAEHALGLSWRILTLLSERRSRLHEVWFPHVPVGSEKGYRRRFGDVPLMFDAEHAALVIPAGDLDLPISEHNDELHDLALSYLDKQLPPSSTPLQVQVRKATEALLGTGTCSSHQVARALNMHPRTLQRRLREGGTTFETIKDETRRDLAQRYLSHPDLPLTQVSALLDYGEQSALARSCQRWFQTTPRTLRTRLSSGTPAPSLT